MNEPHNRGVIEALILSVDVLLIMYTDLFDLLFDLFFIQSIDNTTPEYDPASFATSIGRHYVQANEARWGMAVLIGSTQSQFPFIISFVT